ncbi:hypothetical protein HWV62_36153 [Athelia sp. TMB]|nr:hypothetical protein HWV62_36153 [Athelia sp. TMB]
MDFSQQELPITAFFNRDKKKGNERPTRSTTKRKRQSTDAQQSQPMKKGKEVGGSSKEVPLVDTSLQADVVKLPGKSRVSSATEQGSRASVHDRHSPEVLDLTSPSPEPKKNRSASKRKKLDIPDDAARSALPSPPATRARKLSRTRPSVPTAEYQRMAHGALPTPATSVPRRPFHSAMPRAPSSPLVSRLGAPNTRALSPSLSSCSSEDDGEFVHARADKSHADVAQALFDVAPTRHNKALTHVDGRGANATADPFSDRVEGEILVPSSPLPNTDLPPPLITSAIRRRSSGNPEIGTSPIITSITNLPYPWLEPTMVESSQSQALLPFKDSPRRNRILPQSDIPSSQSQVLLPFWDSPRRQQRTFAPFARKPSSSDNDEIIPSSQSREAEMYIGMNLSQLELHEMPAFHENAEDPSANENHGVEMDTGSSLPESYPRTPSNKRTSKWREIHLGSSPAYTPRHPGPRARRSPQKPVEQFSEDSAGTAICRPAKINKLPSPGADSHDPVLSDSAEDDRTLSKSTPPRDSPPLSPPRATNEDDFDGDVENSLAPRSFASFSSQYPVLDSSLSEDTQALMLAGAPPGSSQFGQEWSAGQSMPAIMKDFVDMFDDDGSYPADFPAHLRC